VLSYGRTEIILYDDAKYRERKEANGLFAAVPALLRSISSPSAPRSNQLALPPAGASRPRLRLP
jgi:hypothetical protein